MSKGYLYIFWKNLQFVFQIDFNLKFQITDSVNIGYNYNYFYITNNIIANY